jgi:SAM-dependent methyltransferase
MTAPRIFTAEYYARMRALEAASWWNAGMRDVAAMLLESGSVPATGCVVDVGCGSGQTLQWFAERFGKWQTIGCDVAPHAVAAARHIADHAIAATALQLPFPDGLADVVVTLDVLQHLPLPDGDLAALKEMRRVLKPRGLLFVRTNAQAFPHTRDDFRYNFHKYTTSELTAKLEQSGFEVLRLSRLNALLGMAEIPREFRAKHASTDEYRGILAQPKAQHPLARALKRRWLAIEGTAVRLGLRLPVGRTIVALCRATDAPPGQGT